jgi:hypothetical protein
LVADFNITFQLLQQAFPVTQTELTDDMEEVQLVDEIKPTQKPVPNGENQEPEFNCPQQ